MEKGQYGRDEKEGDKVYFLVVKNKGTRSGETPISRGVKERDKAHRKSHIRPVSMSAVVKATGRDMAFSTSLVQFFYTTRTLSLYFSPREN